MQCSEGAHQCVTKGLTFSGCIGCPSIQAGMRMCRCSSARWHRSPMDKRAASNPGPCALHRIRTSNHDTCRAQSSHLGMWEERSRPRCSRIRNSMKRSRRCHGRSSLTGTLSESNPRQTNQHGIGKQDRRRCQSRSTHWDTLRWSTTRRAILVHICKSHCGMCHGESNHLGT